MTDTDVKVAIAEQADIERGMEGFLLAAHTLYDIGKALPHPYDAIGDYARTFLHDFAGFAFRVKKHNERVALQLEASDD